MEFYDIGKNCSEITCKRLDFLPVRCDGCNELFCKDHMKYSEHNCPSARDKDIQVPVCPLCNRPVPYLRNQPPDLAVGNHIDQDCSSKTAKSKRKRCSALGCKIKEMVPVLCRECNKNFCLRHRFQDQHDCQGRRSLAANAALTRANTNTNRETYTRKIQGDMSEDEALAFALAESMKDEDMRRRQIPAGGSRQRTRDESCRLS